jgi:hypothetical protein
MLNISKYGMLKRKVETIPRIIVDGKYRINYRHIIDWLVRKPGAFENYKYRDGLFPTHYFRMAYDVLKKIFAPNANREYLKTLYLAATESEESANNALQFIPMAFSASM